MYNTFTYTFIFIDKYMYTGVSQNEISLHIPSCVENPPPGNKQMGRWLTISHTNTMGRWYIYLHKTLELYGKCRYTIHGCNGIDIDNDLTLQFSKGPSPHPMARSAQQSKPRKRKAAPGMYKTSLQSCN